MTVPFNIASRCPVLSVPSGRSRDGVPTGLSVVGRTYDDVTAFRVAASAPLTCGRHARGVPRLQIIAERLMLLARPRVNGYGRTVPCDDSMSSSLAAPF